jgi:DNA-binding transcriptional MerR regulator
VPPPARDPQIFHAIVRAEVSLSSEQLATAAGISLETLDQLVRLGIVEPSAGGEREFSSADAVRLKRMLRLHDDLDLDLEIAAIIEDLLERLEALEEQLWRLRSSS